MQINESHEAGSLIVSPNGRIDSTTSPKLEQRLGEIVARGERRLVLDFADVEYISSAGLRVMLALAKRLQAGGGALVLCGMTPPVRQVFDLAGFLPLFAVDASRAAALARLPAP
jgi:anti-anti-sigma factor